MENRKMPPGVKQGHGQSLSQSWEGDGWSWKRSWGEGQSWLQSWGGELVGRGYSVLSFPLTASLMLCQASLAPWAAAPAILLAFFETLLAIFSAFTSAFWPVLKKRSCRF